MHRYILSLGSNVGEGVTFISLALRKIALLGRVTAKSSLFTTDDIHDSNAPRYTNANVVIESELKPSALNDAVKAMENELGRHSAEYAGKVPIDIDVVVCDDKILRPKDYTAPYFVKGLTLLEP